MNAELGGNNPVPKSGASSSPSPAVSFERSPAQTKRDEEKPAPSQHQPSSDAPRIIATSEETNANGVGDCETPPDLRQAGPAVGRKQPDTAAPRANDGVASDSAPPSVDSLARFSRFLSLLVVSATEEQTPSTTERERVALAELVRARRVGRTQRSAPFWVL